MDTNNTFVVLAVLVILLLLLRRSKLGAVTEGVPEEGEYIYCSSTKSHVIYRYSNNIVRQVTSLEVIQSWGSAFDATRGVPENLRTFDCTSFYTGPTLQLKGSPEPPVPSNTSVRTTNDCNTGAVYYYDGSYLHKYPSDEIARQWDFDYQRALVYDCSNIPVGGDAVENLPANKTVIACSAEYPVKLYYYDDKLVRVFGTPLSVSNHSAGWKTDKVAILDCRCFYQGPAMPVVPSTVYPKPPGPGRSVRRLSDYKTGRVYYYDYQKTLHEYPSDDVARSWDKNYKSAVVYDCSGVTVGDVATKK